MYVYLVIFHIGEAYPEDKRSHAGRGGYDPAIYQWVGSLFSVHTYIYIAILPENEFKRWNDLRCHASIYLF